MMHLRYTYKTLFNLSLLIIFSGFVYFVISFNFIAVIFGFGLALASQEFYETYDIDSLNKNDEVQIY